MKHPSFLLETEIIYDPDALEKLLQQCEEAVDTVTSDADVRFRLKFALQELLVNAAEHGLNQQKGRVAVRLHQDSRAYILEIRDEGKGFTTPLETLDKPLESLDRATIRGWGLVILNRVFDCVTIAPNYPQGTKITLTLLRNPARCQ